MAAFALKDYQTQALKTLGRYLRKAVELNDADAAFYTLTRRPYYPLDQLHNVPYVCLRVPTGGGKTIMAAHSVAVAADNLLQTDTPVVLWLVPSQTIRDQTLVGLKDRGHANR